MRRTRWGEPGLHPEEIEPSLSLATWHDGERLLRARREALVPVNQPMVLITQVPRSGGTLLNTLLDGHPELHSHPYELEIGQSGQHWPRLDPADWIEEWLETLRERSLPRLFAEGYRKGTQRKDAPALPFTVVPSFLERLFRLLVGEREIESSRDVIDAYFTAYFGSWMDLQGYHHEPKRWISAFTPSAGWVGSTARFYTDYPDGRVISVLRDPRSWYASAQEKRAEMFGDFDETMDAWLENADQIVESKRERPDSTLLITFEALVGETERMMREVAAWLDLSWDPILLEPTFNRLPTVPNSSRHLPETGVRTEPLEAWRNLLEDDVVNAVESAALVRYEAVRALADLS